MKTLISTRKKERTEKLLSLLRQKNKEKQFQGTMIDVNVAENELIK